MQDEQKILAIIAVASALAIVALLYSTLSIQGADAKIEARNIVLAGFNAPSSTSQPVQVPAEISLTLITDSKEPKLISLAAFVQQFEQLPELKIVAEKTVEKDSAEGQQMIEKYKIERIPVLLLQGETEKSKTLAENWPKVGTTDPDGTMVLRNVPPIYFGTSTGELRGEVKAVFVSVPDKNGVFDAKEVYMQILQSVFGISAVEQEIIRYDSPEGKAFLERHQIEKIPTVILSGDLNAYAGFQQVWGRVGTAESDGVYVFRSVEAIQGVQYFDMNKNEIIETPQQQQ